jgi:hypothetical protein
MMGNRINVRRMLSHFSPGHPFLLPNTDAGNRFASAR